MANISDHPQLAAIVANHDWPARVLKLRAELAAATKKNEIDFLTGCLRIAEKMAAQYASAK